MKKLVAVILLISILMQSFCFAIAESEVIFEDKFDAPPAWAAGKAFNAKDGVLNLTDNAYGTFKGAKNYQVEAELNFQKFSGFQFSMRARSDEQYCFLMRKSEEGNMLEFLIVFQAGVEWKMLTIKKEPLENLKMNKSYNIKTIVNEDSLEFYFDNELKTKIIDDLIPAKGMSNVFVPAGTSVAMDNLKVTNFSPKKTTGDTPGITTDNNISSMNIKGAKVLEDTFDEGLPTWLTSPTTSSSNGYMVADAGTYIQLSPKLTDYAVEYRVIPKKITSSIELSLRETSPTNKYTCTYQIWDGSAIWRIALVNGDEWRELAVANSTVPDLILDQECIFDFIIVGNKIQWYVNGKLKLEGTDDTYEMGSSTVYVGVDSMLHFNDFQMIDLSEGYDEQTTTQSSIDFSKFDFSHSTYNDIQNDENFNSISLLELAKIITPSNDKKFNPNEPINVDEFLKWIMDINGMKYENGNKYWASNYIFASIYKRYINPLEFNDFKRGITRAEASVLITRIANMPATTEMVNSANKIAVDFNGISEMYKMPVATVISKGYFLLYPYNQFRPNAVLTRSEASSVLVKAFYDKISDMVVTANV